MKLYIIDMVLFIVFKTFLVWHGTLENNKMKLSPLWLVLFLEMGLPMWCGLEDLGEPQDKVDPYVFFFSPLFVVYTYCLIYVFHMLSIVCNFGSTFMWCGMPILFVVGQKISKFDLSLFMSAISVNFMKP
jgi:hypothetical protein